LTIHLATIYIPRRHIRQKKSWTIIGLFVFFWNLIHLWRTGSSVTLLDSYITQVSLQIKQANSVVTKNAVTLSITYTIFNLRSWHRSYHMHNIMHDVIFILLIHFRSNKDIDVISTYACWQFSYNQQMEV
jgi:hypothetical protein